MKKNSRNEPLPEDLLPDAMVHDDPTRWDEQVRRLMENSSSLLATYRRGQTASPWWGALAERFRPGMVAAFAAAATLAIAVHFAVPVRPADPEESLPLATLLSGEQPTTLLSIASGEDDPALALVILEGESP